MANPNLVELTRGGLVESFHIGAVVVARSNGERLISLGETARPIFPRSAVKALQALPMIETGAADHYGFGDAEIALACASHSGTPAHTDRAAAMLRAAGLDVASLACGDHVPMHEPTALANAGRAWSALHNNCSGKHAGMVCTCAHVGDPIAGYLDIGHPNQQRIARVFAEVCGDGFSAPRYGIDGCSAPNWAIPLAPLATAFATLVTGDGLSTTRRAAARRIVDACMARPDMVAGPDRMDTKAMTALPGKVFMKTGAEGVYCGAFPDHGIGFAIKIDDGNKRGAEAVVAGLIAHLYPAVGSFGALGPTRNWAGIETGATRLADGLLRALERLR